LEKQLDNIPKDINDLYEKLLAPVSPGDRVKTFKMLLLADMCSSWPGLTAVTVTWIDKLDDPNFPTSYNLQPYTHDEIKERQLTAKLQLDYYPKGLLEIYRQDGESLMFRERVHFFHRTLRDFVR
jgi:hypothetical protein